jgi:hypothetical protein
MVRASVAGHPGLRLTIRTHDLFCCRRQADASVHMMELGKQGVVSTKLCWAKLSPENGNIHVLAFEKLIDLGNSATFYSVLVEVGLA